jgi:hypothetical protein
VKFSVDPWDVEYGTSAELEAESAGTVVVDIELPAGDWRPLEAVAAAGAGVGSVLFVDGVRRIDARVWIDGDSPGICASYAAGAVRCDGRAEVVDIAVARGMFSTAATAADIVTRHATYPARMAGSNDIAALMLAVHERMTDVEVGIAGRVDGADLVVIDGPLRARTHIDHAVGFIKSHAVRYLPEELHRVVGALAAGQRTPVFTVASTWSRHSWYLRLPGPSGSPWSGIARCECSPDLAPAAAIELANMTAAVLPRFASEPPKDTRAPQNLYPIGGLERELRHRLGDQALLFRSLQRAAATA